MAEYAYLMTDASWPPVLHELRGECPATGLLIISPVDKPGRVLHVYADDLWIVASISQD